jgi:hypothetical protein
MIGSIPLMKESLAAVRVTPEERAKILGGNTAALLGLA